MSSNIQFTGPFLKGFVHTNYTATTTPTTFVAISPVGTRRASVIIQNQSTSLTIQVILSDAGSAGIIVAALGTFTIDNYNGPIRLVSSTGTVTTHIAIALS
jgi:hypothetical protein